MVEKNFKDIVGARPGEVLVEKTSVGRTFAYAVSVLAQMLWIVITTLLLITDDEGHESERAWWDSIQLLGKYEPRHRKAAALPPSAPPHHCPPYLQ